MHEATATTCCSAAYAALNKPSSAVASPALGGTVQQQHEQIGRVGQRDKVQALVQFIEVAQLIP